MSILPPQSGGRQQKAYKNARFHARLRRLIGREAPYAWADRIGISKGAFTRIWKEGTVPTSELLYRIRAATGVSLDWLLTGEGAQQGAGQAAAGDLAYIGEYLPTVQPRSSKSRAPLRQIALTRDWLAEWLDAEPADLAYVTVKGESMAPTLEDGDLALLDRRAYQLEQDGIYALRQGATLRVRRVQRLSGDRYQALSDNPRYHPFTFRLTSRLSVIGRVVWVGKRMPR
jgi:phage repressor protein C with HTH and peptisase S24 domain